MKKKRFTIEEVTRYQVVDNRAGWAIETFVDIDLSKKLIERLEKENGEFYEVKENENKDK